MAARKSTAPRKHAATKSAEAAPDTAAVAKPAAALDPALEALAADLRQEIEKIREDHLADLENTLFKLGGQDAQTVRLRLAGCRGTLDEVRRAATMADDRIHDFLRHWPKG